MAWPGGSVPTTNVDAGGDDPALARADIKTAFDKINLMIPARAAADGVCDLDSGAKIPDARFPTTVAKLAGTQTFTGSKTFTPGVVMTGGIDPGNTGDFLKIKKIEIGDWNMDTTQFVDIAHGLTFTDIITVFALIRNDADTARPMLTEGDASGVGQGQISPGTTNIRLVRLTGGSYDTTFFDSTSYNRGWIIVVYL